MPTKEDFGLDPQRITSIVIDTNDALASYLLLDNGIDPLDWNNAKSLCVSLSKLGDDISLLPFEIEENRSFEWEHILSDAKETSELLSQGRYADAVSYFVLFLSLLYDQKGIRLMSR
ncbi:MAG: hypothetical protein M1355_03615 [Patescibacteria group bacterium]|nr:hypothetical protein [Patescibacteria group bacterium]MCL5094193.1 hypothetical protein [Patescibacteria group bacterium]